MRQRFIIKHPRTENYAVATSKKPTMIETPLVKEEVKESVVKKNNTKKKSNKNMDIDQIEKLASELTPEETTKKIKRDRGLIERTESSKIKITEDNKQLLTD